MKRHFTKKIGVWILLVGLGFLGLPHGLMFSELDVVLFPGIRGDNALIFLFPILACWAVGIGISIGGILCIVLLPFKAKPDRCEKCGYPYTGPTEPRCPECGTKFDPGEITPDVSQRKTPPTSPPSWTQESKSRRDES